MPVFTCGEAAASCQRAVGSGVVSLHVCVAGACPQSSAQHGLPDRSMVGSINWLVVWAWVQNTKTGALHIDTSIPVVLGWLHHRGHCHAR